MFCQNCGKEISVGTKFCPNCGTKFEQSDTTESEKKTFESEQIPEISDSNITKEENIKEESEDCEDIIPVFSDNKEWTSVEEILKDKAKQICKFKGSLKLKEKISDSKAKKYAMKIGQNKIQPEEILAYYDKIVFTKYAMYINENLVTPIIIKYMDITEVGISKSDADECIVRLSNGLEWTEIDRYMINMKGFAEMIRNISDFVHKQDEDEKSKTVISSKPEEYQPTLKVKIARLIIYAAVFSWNSYAIFNNFSAHNGIGWAIFAIIINIVLFVLISSLLDSIIKKSNYKKFSYIIPIVLLFLFGCIGFTPYKTRLAESAAPLVTQILDENFGSYINTAKCQKVINVRKISKGYYSASAVLDNGRLLNISITADNDTIYVQLEDY